MQCISPLHIKRPNGHSNADLITVPCGKCYACLSRKRSEWAFRLQKEQRYASSSYFFTLTYADEHIPVNEKGFPSVSKDDIQRFMKRLRKMYSPTKIRYFITSEYGPTTLRPHYHGLIFGSPAGSVDDFYKDLDKAWRLGYVQSGTVTDASINYCAKYCITRHSTPAGSDPCFSLSSRRPGLGAVYADKHGRDLERKLQDWSYLSGGYRVRLPRYLRERIFDDAQRRILADRVQAYQRQQTWDLVEEYEAKGQSYYAYEIDLKQDYIRRMEKQLTKKSKHSV